MTKTPGDKRSAVPPRAVEFTSAFQKDWRRLARAGRHDMRRLKLVMMYLIGNEQPLGPEWLDHPLKGNWSDHRECHIGGDFLLIYRATEDMIIFVRCGSHSDLFG